MCEARILYVRVGEGERLGEHKGKNTTKEGSKVRENEGRGVIERERCMKTMRNGDRDRGTRAYTSVCERVGERD